MRRLARLLLYFGIAGTVLGLSKFHAAWVAVPAYDFTGSSRFAWALAYIGVLALTAYGLGLPEEPRSLRSAEISAFAASGIAGVAMSLIQLLVGDALLPRFVVLGTTLVVIPWYLVCIAVANGGRLSQQSRDRVALVGDAGESLSLADDLAASPERAGQLVLALTTDDAHRAASSSQTLLDGAIRAGATVVVLSRSAQTDEDIVAQAATLHERGIRVRTLSMFYEQWLGKLPLAELERVSLMFDIGELHRAIYGRIKRLGDVVVGVVGCLVLALAVPVVAAGNLVGNRGPLFYTQIRVGKNGRRFTILKFRTMVAVEAGPPDSTWTSRRDPRITPFGHLLRRSHLDELPQMINILRGDLSLVGPRPEQPHYVTELSAKLPFYEMRHLVRPGLTGWAQVKYGYAADHADALEKLQYEFYYLRHQSLALDARIVGRTIRSVLRREGR